jgi:hypothetical protein
MLFIGRLLAMQSSLFRFNSRHCSLDPDRSFWMIEDVNEVHICFYFTVFFVTPDDSSQTPSICVHELCELVYCIFVIL